MSLPFIKFYPTDWSGDKALRSCSVTARGVWLEICFVMHEATPYGHLLLAGKPPSSDALARSIGATAKELAKSLAELEAAGVFSRTAEGVIYSRRMVRDEAVRLARAEGGKAGGNPTLRREEGYPSTQPSTHGKVNLPPNLGVNLEPRAHASARTGAHASARAVESGFSQGSPSPSETTNPSRITPPSPLAGGANAATDSGNEPPGPQPEPRRQRPRRKPAEPWADVLERPEFAPLRESESFVFGWNSWVEHCQTQGSAAREPGGPRAVAMFREALRVGPAKYAKAIEQAIGRNWKAPCVEALERGNAGTSGPVPNIAQRNMDAIREQTAALFGGRVG